MAEVTIDPFEQCTREQLILLLKQEAVRHNNQAKRVRNLELENQRQFLEFQQTITNLRAPSVYRADADEMAHFLLDLLSVLRPLLGCENVKYGIRNLAFGYEPNSIKKMGPRVKVGLTWMENVRNVAMVVRDIQDYFDWDDK